MKDTVRKPRALPNDADTGVDYSTAVAVPGALKGSATMSVQTRQAQSLVRGRSESAATPDAKAKYAIIGLVRFGFNMNRMWEAARADDPYADWFLIRMTEALTEARQDVTDKLAWVQGVLKSMPAIHVDVGNSSAPVSVPLYFTNPYGYMGAYLLSDYDHLVRAALTAKHVALTSTAKANEIIQDGGRRVRSAYALSGAWRNFTVTRADIRQNTQRAQQARAAMGALPDDILAGTWRAEVAPQVRKQAVEADQAPADTSLASVG